MRARSKVLRILLAQLSLAALVVPGTALAQSAQSAPPTQEPPSPTDQLARGQIVDPVACTGFPGQSYALYLPSAYTPERTWPVIYVYDPRERGSLAAELHRAAAERLGWIVVASNNTRSDERENDPNAAAMQATWEDSHRRFAIDPKRVYATGFSGGARAAALLGNSLPDRVAGVIGHGGGFPMGPRGPRPEGAPTFAFYGLAGRRDFNVSEMTQLEADLAGLGTPHHLEFFDAAHSWAPASEIEAAMIWMELRAAPAPPSTLSRQLLAELQARAGSARTGNDLLDAVRRFEMLDREFARLLDVESLTAIRAAVAEIRRSKAFVEQEREAREALADERTRLTQAMRTLAEYLGPAGPRDVDLETDPAGERISIARDPRRTASRLDLARLHRDAANHSSRFRRDSAARLLSTLTSQTSFYMAREYAVRGDRESERLLQEISVLAAPDNVTAWLRLAGSRAATGRAREAIAALHEASKRPAFGDRNRADETAGPDFDAVRKRQDFRDWLAAGAADRPAPQPSEPAAPSEPSEPSEPAERSEPAEPAAG